MRTAYYGGNVPGARIQLVSRDPTGCRPGPRFPSAAQSRVACCASLGLSQGCQAAIELLASRARNGPVEPKIAGSFAQASALDLRDLMDHDRMEGADPTEWFAAFSLVVESLTRVTKLDIPLITSLSMRRRIYSARKVLRLHASG